MTEKPPCAVCGQPYHRHNIGAMATCPIIATYRPTPATDVSAEDVLAGLRKWHGEMQRSADQLTAYSDHNPELKQAAVGTGEVAATIKKAINLIAALQSQAAKLKEVEEERERLSDRVQELSTAPWPDWAKRIYDMLVVYGFSPDSEEVDLPDVLAGWLEDFDPADHARALAAEARLAQMRADVVEECAAVADQWLSAKPETALMIGTAIRDLAGKGAV